MERFAVERFAVERAVVERFAVERFAVERPVLRVLPELELALLRVERELEVFDGDSAWRSLSKSLSACLLALPASRRSARSAVVTSL